MVCGVLIGGALVCWGIGYSRTPTVMFGLGSGVVKAAAGGVSTHLFMLPKSHFMLFLYVLVFFRAADQSVCAFCV